jgi:hypothetical protein
MKAKILENLEKIELALKKGFDIIIKINKDGEIKIAYQRPRNISTIET